MIKQLSISNDYTSKFNLEYAAEIVIGSHVGKFNGGAGDVPNVFYVGEGKTGSTSILLGTSLTGVQWHNPFYFSQLMGNPPNLNCNSYRDLYELILFIGSNHCFKPILIECYREPISRSVSLASQLLETGAEACHSESQFVELVQAILFGNEYIPEAFENWNSIFGIDIINNYRPERGYFFLNLDSICLCFLQYEKLYLAKSLISLYNTDFKLKHENNSQKRLCADFYNFALNHMRFSCDQ